MPSFVRSSFLRPLLSCWVGGAFLLALAPEARAGSTDPSRSSVFVTVPNLAPGAWGSAPVSGEIARGGQFHLVASVGALHTPNVWQALMLRQFLPPTITLSSSSVALLSRSGATRHMRAAATLQVGGLTAPVSLRVRLLDTAKGRRLRTAFSLPLAAYGVNNPAGGPPGNVNVSIDAFAAGL